MRLLFVSKKSCSVLFAGLLMLVAHGASAAQPGGYLGFSLGSADDEILNESDTGYKLLGGYVASANLGGEIAFVDLGSYPAFDPFFGPVILDQYGIAFNGIGYLPVGNNFDLFGKLGLFAWTVDVGFATDDGLDLTYGFGASLRMDYRLSIRAEWERFTDISGGDVDLVSAGIAYHF